MRNWKDVWSSGCVGFVCVASIFVGLFFARIAVAQSNDSTLQGAWYLSFPLAGHASTDTILNTIFDHHMSDGPYKNDGTAVAWTGETSQRNFGCWENDCPQGLYAGDANKSTIFTVNGTYTGGSWGKQYLSYDDHPGIDFQASEGTEIHAPADGDLQGDPKYSNAAGVPCNAFYIYHGNGYRTLILHSEIPHIADGHVLRGQVVGHVGKECTEAYHLHFQVEQQVNGNWVPVDPYGWAGGCVDPYTNAVSTNLWVDSGATNITRWDFNTTGNMEGWRPTSDQYGVTAKCFSVNNGAFVIQPRETNPDPGIISPPLVNIDAGSFRTVKLRVASLAPDGQAKIYFATDAAASNFSEDKSVSFTIVNDGQWRELSVDMSQNSSWTGAITAIRIDPSVAGSSGDDSIGFDYIELSSDSAAPIPAAITSPANQSTLSGSAVTFQWTSGTGVSGYTLYVGTAPGYGDLYSGAQITDTSATVSGLPTDGRTLYVRLWSNIGGTLQYNDYTYTAALIGVTPIAASMTSPTNGSTLSGASVMFQWTTGTAVQQYFLYIGNSPGQNDVYAQNQGTNTSATVNSLPTDGRKLYVRLWSLAGSTWLFNDYTYTAALIGVTPIAASMTSPTNGSTLSGASVMFQWTTGTAVQQYFLYIGNSPGQNDVYAQNQGTNTSATVNSLPTDGRKLYVRLWSLAGSTWLFNDYTYTAALIGVTPIAASMTSPTNGSTLSGASVMFQWTTGTAVQQYFLYVGNSPGQNDVYAQNQGTNTSATVNSLPTDGRKLYVRLWSLAGSTWLFNDYTYTAALIGVTPIAASMTSPTNGSTLSGASVMFQWTTGTAVQQYFLYVGNSPGQNDVYAQNQGTNTSATVNSLPTDGRKLYVRLWSLAGSTWLFNDYTYTAAGGDSCAAASMTSPANGSATGGSSVTFQWTAGTCVTDHFLYVGTAQGQNNIFAKDEGNATQDTVGGLPADGSTIFVRLWSQTSGTWYYYDYTYVDNRFYVGQAVSVYNTNGLGLNLRSCANTSCSVIVNMPDGTAMQVIGGPTQAAGYTWWNLSGTARGIFSSGWAIQDYLH